MNNGEDTAPSSDDASASPLLSLDLEFAPAWAKKAPEVSHQRYADDARSGAHDNRRPGPDRNFRRDTGNRDRRPAPRGAPSPEARRDGGNRPDRGAPRPGPGQDRTAPRPQRNAFHADVRRPEEPRRDFRPAVRPEQPPLPLEIRVLPDQKALGAVIRKIQTSHRAYPLRDIARLFLDNDSAYQIRMEALKGQELPLFQCKVCNLPALSEEEIRTHLLTTHLGDFFDVSEIETDPPAGNFVCVARCGLSGELLGPPNHHSYATRVQEMLRTRYAHMSPEAYRTRIEMVRDPEAVAKWRESCRKKIVYRRKRPNENPAPVAEDPDAAAPDAAPAAETEVALGPAMERAAAELVFQREILPEQIICAKHLVCPAAAVRRTPSARLLEAVRETMNRELNFPASLFFALRGAFRHRSLHLFRASNDRGPEFVAVREPVVLDASHVVADLRLVLEHISQHPGCTRTELLTTLANGDEKTAAHLATQLNTLVEKAHVIEFYNGILCPPSEHPAFRYLPGERDGRKPAEGKKTVDGKRKTEDNTQASDTGHQASETAAQAPTETSASTAPEVAAESVSATAVPTEPATEPIALPVTSA